MVNFLRIRKKKADTSTIDQVLDGSATLLQIDFETIRVATGDFSVENKLGEGGFGVVYKGILPADGKEIAVKRLSRNSGQGVQEFMNEVALGAKLHHKNLVRLYGCCVEVQEKLLVYEYIPNRSLDYFLFDPDKRPSLDWERRFKIIGGIARGLLYLHEDSRLRIIHRDLKASNILLDANMIPKISDFGMAKIIGGDQTSGSTQRIAGTFGYMAPEYAMRGQFSVKTDVYSFGVLLLEIISGQKNQYKEDRGEDLLSYVWKAWNDGTILGIIDSSISEHCSRSEVVRCINIGLLCVQEDATTRPSMSLVVMMLTSFSHTMLAVPSTPAYFNVEPTFQDSSTENQLDSSSRNSRIFHSRDALVNRARDVGKRNSFVIVIKVSNAARPGIKARVVPAYERSGYYKQSKTIDEGTTKKKIKQTGSKKCGCPFTLKGKELDTSDDWMLEVACDVHSHSAAEYLEGHSFTGRLTKEETKLMVDMSKSMVRPKDILATLKQRSELNVNNAYHRHRVVERGGRTQMQQLMNMLMEHKYIECHRNCEDSDIITDLVWAHPTSIQLLRAFPHVLIIDCTYKTNRYRMPLLEIVGLTSTDMTFSVCFAYMEAEREGNYAWALGVLRSVIGEDALPDVIVTDKELSLMKAINSVFPNARHLLCKWHINKNVLAKCKKLFETKDKWEKFTLYWNLLVHSSTEQEYIDHLHKLNQEFSTYPAALQYVKDSWLDEYKERFVSAWVDKCMHFGSTTSNRAESSHSQLKRQLGSSQGTFETNWAKTHSLLELQHTSIKASFEKSKTIVQHSFKPSEFKKLRGNISRNSLEKILAETKRSNLVGIDRIACGCILRSTHGLPCAHEIAAYISEGRPIPLESIHSHWTKLDMNPCTISKFSTIELDYKAELGLLEQRFNEYDETRKLQLLKKMRELSKPDNTFLLDPAVKTRTRGRPRTRIDTSTRREPSAFELVESTQDSHSPAPISTKAALEQKPKKGNHRVVRTRSKSVSSYTTQFSEGLRPYVHFIKDVVADGNCGFRAIAALIGHTNENGWRQVRRELLQELLAHIDNYKQLYGVENRVEELIETLSYYEEHPSYNHWLTMPDMGHLIASRYNLVLFHFSAVQCLTFLPLRSAPLPAATRLEKAIGFVNQNHFVQVFMIPDHPIPPIANKWREFHHPCANGWELAYEDRIRHFKEIISPDVATCETVSLN